MGALGNLQVDKFLSVTLLFQKKKKKKKTDRGMHSISEIFRPCWIQGEQQEGREIHVHVYQEF